MSVSASYARSISFKAGELGEPYLSFRKPSSELILIVHAVLFPSFSYFSSGAPFIIQEQ